MSTTNKTRVELFTIVALVALMAWGLTGGAAEKAAKPADEKKEAATATAGSLPDSLIKCGDASESIYDAAKAKDWAKVKTEFATLKEAAAKVPADMAKFAAKQKKRMDRLQASVTALDKAVTAKEQKTVMEQSNLATVTVARLADSFHPKAPFEVTKLDYEGRRLEMYSELGDVKKLQSASKAVDSTWTALKPRIVAKGGNTEAKEFDTLVGQMKKAKTAKDYAAVAKPILDAVDNLEKVFVK